jgi:hypothetical protein
MGKIGADGRDLPSTRPLLDKLGLKPGHKVSIIGLDDRSFVQQLRDRSIDVSSRARKNSDLIFIYLDNRRGLPRLTGLHTSLKPAGAIWVLWPKGRKEFREDDIRAFGPEAGLVDVKVVAFSETLSALKMVIPVALRPRV